MRFSWAVLGLLAVSACGPTPQKTPKNTDECQSYAASRAGLSFSSVEAKQAYFNSVITSTHGGNTTVRPTYLGCLDKIGALPEGVTSTGQAGTLPVSERAKYRSDVMSGGAGYKVVYLRSESKTAGELTASQPLGFTLLPRDAALLETMTPEQQIRALVLLSTGETIGSSFEGGL